MSFKRFEFLLDCLRFDHKTTRADDKLIINCYNNYKPGRYVTIDEKLEKFRGQCAFQMNIPNKPVKYCTKKNRFDL